MNYFNHTTPKRYSFRVEKDEWGNPYILRVEDEFSAYVGISEYNELLENLYEAELGENSYDDDNPSTWVGYEKH